MPTTQEVLMAEQMRRQNSPLAQLAQVGGNIFQGYQKRQQAEGVKKGQAAAANFLNLAVQNPDRQDEYLTQALQADPQFVKTFFDAKKAQVDTMGGAAQQKPFQMGENGLVFNPNTGTYSVDQTAKDMLTKKAKAKAQEGSKLGVKDIQGINKDVTGLIKDTVGISSAASSLDNLKASSSPSAQLAAIFKFMKALDPTSVVREGEQDMARKTGGPADYLVGYVNDIQGKGGLTPEVFTDMVNTSKNLANSAISTTQTEIESYLDVFGDTIPEDFKAKVKSRIPATMGNSEQVDSDISEMSDDDLKKSLGL
jgi:hypothetical protein